MVVVAIEAAAAVAITKTNGCHCILNLDWKLMSRA